MVGINATGIVRRLVGKVGVLVDLRGLVAEKIGGGGSGPGGVFPLSLRGQRELPASR